MSVPDKNYFLTFFSKERHYEKVGVDYEQVHESYRKHHHAFVEGVVSMLVEMLIKTKNSKWDNIECLPLFFEWKLFSATFFTPNYL